VIGPQASAALARLPQLDEQATNGADFSDYLQITTEIARDEIHFGRHR
jgi:hypothetical protein